MTREQLIKQADQQLFNKLRNNSNHCLHSLLTLQRHNFTNCATEHTAEKYLKELGTSKAQISLRALYT